MVGETSLAASPFSVFGSLPQYIPARASCHPALNAAMEYTIQSYHSWKKQDAMEDRKTMALGTTALATLRQGPESDFESNSNALMASIALHIMAEVWIAADESVTMGLSSVVVPQVQSARLFATYTRASFTRRRAQQALRAALALWPVQRA